MTKLLDISDEGQRGTTPHRGQQLDINGLSARQIARLLTRHESLKASIEKQDVNLFQLVEMAPEAIAACIAYGTGYDDDERYGGDKAAFDSAALRASRFNAGEQVDVVMAICDITFGEKLNPFVKRIIASIEARAKGGVENLADRTGRPPSLRQLRDALRSKETPEQFGATHPGNSPASPV